MIAKQTKDEIIIVGAGIGGLTLARALEKKGVNFQLYEQANSFEALGYGIQLSPNVVRVFEELGLLKQLEKVSHPCLGFELRSFKADNVLATWQLDSPTPYYQCRRADLHQILFNSLEDKSRTHFSQRLESYEQKEEHLCLHWENGNPITTKALVAADGVRSQVRRSLFPEYEAKYAGYAAYRAILPFQDKYSPLWGKTTVWMGKNHHVVVYPNGKDKDSTAWLNLVLVVKDKRWSQQGWTIRTDKDKVAKEFSNRSALLNDILKDMVASAEPCFKWGLFIHEPLPYWSKGNVTLLGDAAHPMLPFQAQGAAMAIEDAYLLVQCLDRANNIEKAFIDYQDARMQRTTKVQQVSRNNAGIFHAAGIKATVRNFVLAVVSMINPSLFNKKSAWIYDYDPTVDLEYL
ncbi:MAG: FAD-dependent monooxygenase [Crocosphaera sp.]|nr:FAD-dependent monooxygenase [Crocosphaera sp.]